MCVPYLRKLEEGVESPNSSYRGLLAAMWVLNPSPLEEQAVPLAAEPSV